MAKLIIVHNFQLDFFHGFEKPIFRDFKPTRQFLQVMTGDLDAALCRVLGFIRFILSTFLSLIDGSFYQPGCKIRGRPALLICPLFQFFSTFIIKSQINPFLVCHFNTNATSSFYFCGAA